MALRALIFDVDGTLAETDELHRSSFNAAFGALGLDWKWTPNIYASLPSSVTDADRVRAYSREHRNTAPDLRVLDALLDDILEAKAAIYSRAIENGSAALRPGIARLLKEARNAQIPIGISTLLRRHDFEYLLQNHLGIGAMSMFQVITSLEDLGAVPSIASAFGRTLAALGTRRGDTVAITATPRGAAAAARSGMQVIATPGLYTSSSEFRGATRVLSDLGHPAAPFEVISGDAKGHGFVSVDALREWSDERLTRAA